jgi:hypothetical protein
MLKHTISVINSSLHAVNFILGKEPQVLNGQAPQLGLVMVPIPGSEPVINIYIPQISAPFSHTIKGKCQIL